MSTAAAFVSLLVVYRLTLLVTHDPLTERPVEAAADWLNRRRHPDPPAGDANPVAHADVLNDRLEHPHVVVKLMDCPWCVSFWIGLGVFASAWWWNGRWWWWVIAGGLAGSGIAGLLADLSHPSGRGQNTRTGS